MSTSIPRRRERLPAPVPDEPPTAQGSWFSRSALRRRFLSSWAGVLFFMGGLAVAQFVEQPWKTIIIVTVGLFGAQVMNLVYWALLPENQRRGLNPMMMKSGDYREIEAALGDDAFEAGGWSVTPPPPEEPEGGRSEDPPSEREDGDEPPNPLDWLIGGRDRSGRRPF